MRISKSRNKRRQVAYTVELSEYDAEPPSREWLLDEFPNQVNPELEAVALYLLFGPWCGGEFVVPQKMSPNTASAIGRDAVNEMFVGPVGYYPKPLPSGARSVRIVGELSEVGEDTFLSLASDEWNGGLRSTNSLVLTSNSHVFGLNANDVRVSLAPALLLAEQLDARQFEYAFDSDDQVARLQTLLREIRISLTHKRG